MGKRKLHAGLPLKGCPNMDYPVTLFQCISSQNPIPIYYSQLKDAANLNMHNLLIISTNLFVIFRKPFLLDYK